MRLLSIITAGLLLTSTSFAASTFTLKKSEIYKKSGTGICGYVNKKWTPVAKSGKSYKKVSGSSALKSLCKSLLKKSKFGLSDIPGVSGLLASNDAASSSIGASTVSGTPPTLAEIKNLGASNIFWRTGVISAINSGSPSNEQCNELFGASADGSSSGFAGCYMAQETGYMMENIIQSGTTLCYMKNFPTRDVQNDGGFTVVEGSLPGNDITKLFTPPSGNSPRFVKVNIQDERGSSSGIFKIYSQGQNETNGDQYRYDIVFCGEGSNTPQEYERTKITLAGELITRARHSQDQGGEGENVIKAFLTKVNGDLIINPALGRSAEFTSVSDGFTYKSSLTLNSENEIENKVISSQGDSTRKGFSISRFTGESAPTVRFLEGGYKESSSDFGTYSIATEYRDTYYAATSSSPYSSRLSEVDISSDSFYNQTPSISNSSAPISCGQDVDVEIDINMSSNAMQSVSSLCEADRLDGMDFCRDTALTQAQTNFNNVCTNQQ